MTKTEFLKQANPMMCAVDEAMARMFGRNQTEAERKSELELKEDEFISRKEAEARRIETFTHAGV